MKIVIQGIQINYEVTGSGEYVFLLHGWGSSLSLFSNLAKVISEKYTVVSLDFPGFGLSEEPKTVWDVSSYSDFLVEFIKHFQCDKVILLGHSFGGRVIIKTANRSDLPFSIEKIILVDSAGIRPKRTLISKVRLVTYKLSKRILLLPLVMKLFPDALNHYRKKMGSSDYNNATEMMRGILVKTVNEDLTALLPNIQASTLLIWGENDLDTPVTDGKIMENLIPDAGLVVLKAAGHYSFLDQPYVFHKVIKSFLKVGE